jgi:exodeoxyribonuclease V alpha subunit
MPYIDSPFKKPEIWQNKADCLFLDSDEATQLQLSFIARVKKYHELKTSELHNEPDSNLYEFRVNEPLIPYETELTIPRKFQHVNLENILKTQTRVDELLAILEKVQKMTRSCYEYS